MSLIILQNKIDKLISVMGTQQATEFLDLIIGEADKKIKISKFISIVACEYNNISKEELYSDSKKRTTYQVSRCRAVCYKLHEEFLDMSYRKIGNVYNTKENAVMRGMRSVNDTIKNSNIDPDLNEKYFTIKAAVKKFIKHIPDER